MTDYADMSETPATSTTLVPMPTSLAAKLLGEGLIRKVPVPDAEPPDQIAGLAGEYIGLSIAGGLAFGLLLGALSAKAKARPTAAGNIAKTHSEPLAPDALLQKMAMNLLKNAVKRLIQHG